MMRTLPHILTQQRIGAILVCIFLCYTHGVSQNWKRIDSLRYRIAMAKNDSLRIQFLTALATEIYVVHPDSALAINQQAIEIARTSGLRWGMAEASRSWGYILQRAGRLQEAVDHYVQALQIFSALHDTVAMGNTYNGLGMAYFHAGYDSIGIANLHRAIFLSEKKLAQHAPSIYTNVATYYARRNRPDSSVYYGLRSVQSARELGLERALPFSYLALAEGYSLQKKHHEALRFIQQADSINKHLNNALISMRKAQVQSVWHRTHGDFDKAISWAEQYIAIATRVHQVYFVRDAYMIMYATLRSAQQYQRALLYLDTLQILREKIIQKEEASSFCY